MPLPFFSDANADLWHAAVGYEIAGIVGMLLCGAVVYGLATVIRRSGRRAPDPVADAGRLTMAG